MLCKVRGELLSDVGCEGGDAGPGWRREGEELTPGRGEPLSTAFPSLDAAVVRPAVEGNEKMYADAGSAQ